jgi:hypothetical protein
MTAMMRRTGLALASALAFGTAIANAQVSGNPPTAEIIRWTVQHAARVGNGVVWDPPIVVYDRALGVGTPDSIFAFDHLELDIVDVRVDISDPDWIQPITTDPVTGEVTNGNEPVFLRMRLFGQEQFAPPNPPPVDFFPEGWFPEDEGFRPIPGPTTPYHYFHNFEFMLPEFIGRNQLHLNGTIDFDVGYLADFCAANQKPTGTQDDTTVIGCAEQRVRVLENPSFRPPNPQAFADAGPDKTVATGTVVELDGSRTFDSTNVGFNPDDQNIFEKDQIIFAWEWLSGPVRVDPVQSDANNPVAEVTLNTLGTYVYRLTVDDGASTTLPTSDTVSITVVESLPPENAPTAVIVGPANGVPVGAIITLDGSKSFDPDGNPLNFRWRQTNEIGEPLTGSDLLNAFQPLSGVEAAVSTWQAVNPGTFYFRLLVDDGQFLVNATFTVQVIDSQTSGRTDVAETDSGSNAPGVASDVVGAVVPACATGLAPLALMPLAMLLLRRRRA